jgi:hypothetical protein
VKRGGSLSFLVGTISNVLVMEIGWTDVGSGGDIPYLLNTDRFIFLSKIWEKISKIQKLLKMVK